jgi:hypothetical protein
VNTPLAAVETEEVLVRVLDELVRNEDWDTIRADRTHLLAESRVLVASYS